MAIEGIWTAGLKATKERLNASQLQYDIEANRPAAGQKGLKFISSDTKKVYRDTGSTWETVIDVDTIAATPSLRTLGTSSTQAAAGNHTHSST